MALKLVLRAGRAAWASPHLWLDYIDVATLGTLSDMMLHPAARTAPWWQRASRACAGSPRPGLVALAATAGQDIAQVTADGLPLLHHPAPERRGPHGRHGRWRFDLLLTDDPAEAAVLAGKLEDDQRPSAAT